MQIKNIKNKEPSSSPRKVIKTMGSMNFLIKAESYERHFILIYERKYKRRVIIINQRYYQQTTTTIWWSIVVAKANIFQVRTSRLWTIIASSNKFHPQHCFRRYWRSISNGNSYKIKCGCRLSGYIADNWRRKLVSNSFGSCFLESPLQSSWKIYKQ